MRIKVTLKAVSYYLAACLLALPILTKAQSFTVKPEWQSPVKLVRGNEKSLMVPTFTGAQYSVDELLPTVTRLIPVESKTSEVKVTLDNLKYTPLTETEKQILSGVNVPATPKVDVSVMLKNGEPFAEVTVKPFAIDPMTGQIAKLESFNINLSPVATFSISDTINNPDRYARHSKLTIGNWFKVLVKETGIHKIDYEELKAMGMPMEGINPAFISMYGYGGEMLNEIAGKKKYDDLAEISIKVVTAKPGVFSPGDYILFYGQGPVTWNYNPSTGRVEHQTHLYTNEIVYYITSGALPGKRVPDAEPVTGNANYLSSSYTALAVLEEESMNILKSGRKWFGNKLDIYTRSINLKDLSFPDIDLDSKVSIGLSVAGRSTVPMTFNVKINGAVVATTTTERYYGDNDFAAETVSTDTFKPTAGNMSIQLQYNPPNNSALGWFDYLNFNVRSRLVFKGGQMSFRDPLSIGENRVTQFSIESSQSSIELWDVTDHAFANKIPVTRSGNTYTFKVNTTRFKEFIAFDGTSFLKTSPAGKVENQDLHGTGNYDMIIIAHPTFNSQASRLARLHNQQGDIRAKVISLQQIYNEFSSGHTDITAIRDFMKMLYDKGHENGYPKYLLLFGSASYDYKNRITNNSNLVPTFESNNSVKPILSFLSDDYFGLLDDGEGNTNNQVKGLLDVATGRFPVRTVEEATTAVNKVEAYLNSEARTFGDWRNTLLIIADDEDGNVHFTQAEKLTKTIKDKYPVYNVHKIYLDAFRQNSTPGGGRYPDANRELVSQVDKGALITNYIGHGGEDGWADERVLEIKDINAWKNFNSMGLFFTATCEFSRFDNPAKVSAGELVFTNPKGGSLALITTTRLAYSTTNEALNMSFIDTALNNKQIVPRLGDILKHTKNDNGASANNRQLTLFGDPSLPLPLPVNRVVTTSLVDAKTHQPLDTLSANTDVIITGMINDTKDQLLANFNGEVYVKIYDKPSIVRTLAQDITSHAANFEILKNIIYQGQASVVNGIFSITFPVPSDINYSFGKGKISYYATDGKTDAHGISTDLVIGGSKDLPVIDDKGPDISLYINDSTFADGDITSENPKLHVKLFDASGINTIGNGVGHDLVAILDENNYNSVLLNNFYVADRDSYQSGKAKYQFFKLPDGPHTITIKAWDVFNNSSTATINFLVKHDIRLDIGDVVAYPNPTRGEIWFKFNHNLFDENLDVEIDIFDSNGNLVRVLTPGMITATGYTVEDLYWDGTSSNGKVLRSGLYVCRVKVHDRNGNSSAHNIKILLTK